MKDYTENFVIWAIIALLLWGLMATIALVSVPLHTLNTVAQIGDSFGGLNTLFSGLALAGVIVALILQTEELKIARLERKETMETQRQVAGLTFFNSIAAAAETWSRLAERQRIPSGEWQHYQRGRIAIEEFKVRNLLECLLEELTEVDLQRTVGSGQIIKRYNESVEKSDYAVQLLQLSLEIERTKNEIDKMPWISPVHVTVEYIRLARMASAILDNLTGNEHWGNPAFQPDIETTRVGIKKSLSELEKRTSEYETQEGLLDANSVLTLLESIRKSIFELSMLLMECYVDE